MIPAILTLENYFFNPHSLPFFLSGILIIAESVFVFLQNRKSATNYTFNLATFAAGVWLTGIGMMYCSKTEAIASLWCKNYCWPGIVFITPGVYLFSMAWETSSLKGRAMPVFLVVATGIIFSLLSIFTDYFVQGTWHYPWGFYPKAGLLELPFLVLFAVLMVLSFHNFIRYYRKEQILIRKKQTKLIIIAFTFGFVGAWDFIGNFGIPLYAFGGPFAMLFSTVMAYAIVNYKLMEIETVIHKTIAWFLTSVALVAPLAALLYFTRPWYTRLSPPWEWAYFAVVLLLFMFFVKAYQPKIDNFFQKGRVYIEGVLSRFSGELVHLKGLGEVTKKIRDTITETIHAGNVKTLLEFDRQNPFLKWLSKNDQIINYKFIEIDPRYESIRFQAEQYFKKEGAVICMPLVLNEKLIGVINLGQKPNLKPYNALDYQFLSRLKNQATIAISNSLVYDKVEDLVKVRTEELIQAQKQLVQAEKLATVGILAGGVAHEINNPLAAILTNAQMMLLTAKDKDDKDSLQLIEEAAKRCRSIVQKLMAYSRKPMTGREVKNVDLKIAINNVNSFLGYQLAQENIKVNIEEKNPPFIVDGCQNELEQVFTNLFLNSKDAIKKIKKSGEINVRISKAGNNVIIRIKDDGCGIPKECLPKIFDPFFTTKDVGKGTGLGLSICHSIIDEHKGTISAESKEGHGSTFTVALPAHSPLDLNN